MLTTRKKIGPHTRTCVGVPGFRVQLTVRVSGVLLGKVVIIWDTELGEVFYHNDEDVRRKFENYPLMETSPGAARFELFLSRIINRNI